MQNDVNISIQYASIVSIISIHDMGLSSYHLVYLLNSKRSDEEGGHAVGGVRWEVGGRTCS